jgi:phosphotriesterase-related protein
MSTVETVRGAVDTAALGQTLMHEHVFVLSTEHVQNYGVGDWWDEDERVADAVAKLQGIRDLGVETIVDPTVWGLGRYIPRIQRINEQVDVNIVVATGIYTYDSVPHQYEHRGVGLMIDDGSEPMAGDFLRDIERGIGETGVKAAFLKCAIDAGGLTPGVERVLRACAIAHRESGVPITVHTSSHNHAGRLALGVFTEEGVDLTKVVVGHAGDSNDLDYLREMADQGATLGMDRFGLDLYNPTSDRIDTIVALAEAGYADRMVLSHDASCYIDYFPGEAQAAVAQIAPNWNYTHISNDVIPALLERGVSQDQVDQMMIGNPRRYFERAT